MFEIYVKNWAPPFQKSDVDRNLSEVCGVKCEYVEAGSYENEKIARYMAETPENAIGKDELARAIRAKLIASYFAPGNDRPVASSDMRYFIITVTSYDCTVLEYRGREASKVIDMGTTPF